jgi:hypothetical protein
MLDNGLFNIRIGDYFLITCVFLAYSLAKPLFALMPQQRQQDMVLLLLTGQKGSWFWPLLH